MKTMKFGLVALLFSMILPLSLAHAYVDNPYGELYAVGSNGSTTFQPTFTWNQLPYLYIQFYSNPPVNGLSELTLSTWGNTSESSTFSPVVAGTTANQEWISFSQSQWNSIKALGTWDTSEITFNSITGNAAPLLEQASFTVNAAPEPASTVLFLVGALIMGIALIRRKKAIVA